MVLLWKSLAVAQNIEELTHNPVIPLPHTFPVEMKIHSHKNLYKNVHYSIFLIVKSWRQSKCPPTNE